jgi:class 3 adenylate cyclase
VAWNQETSKKRVDEHDFHDFEVNVQDLSKSMDFSNLGTKDVRRANAAHLYADIPNFHLAVRDAGGDKAKQKKLVRAASVLRKVQGDLLKAADIVGEDEAGRIQFQAARLHALVYKPYADEAKRARHAVVTAITLNTYIYQIFNDVFSDLPRKFQSGIGVSAGTSLIANIGFHGDRERICLGTPANLAAKVLGPGNTIRMTGEVYKQLPEELKPHFTQVDDVAGSSVYEAKGLRWDIEPDLATSLGVTWKAEKWKKSTEDYRDELPLDQMDVRWAEVKIDIDALTERNSRRTDAIALYADLDGFTKYVQEAEKDNAVVSLVRELHMIRHEFHAVVKKDYPGLVLQHQGDRVFAILHEPCGDYDSDHQKRCRKAVDAAIGLQSSMEHVLRDKLPTRKDLEVAVGLEVGTALVTRLGKKGKREVVCLGPEVCEAEKLQLKSAGKQIRISEAVYSQIEAGCKKAEFKKEGGAYVATDLTFPNLEEKEAKAKAAASSVLSAGLVKDWRAVEERPVRKEGGGRYA